MIDVEDQKLVDSVSALFTQIDTNDVMELDVESEMVSADQKFKNHEHKRISYTLAEFDPNKLDIQGWMNLGLSEKQSRVIVNYMEKGGKFFDKEDVKKMYSISDEKYLELEPYIRIAQKNGMESDLKESLLDLNMMDSLDLLALKGIGPVFASRILKYKKLLGGFYSKEQLLEVYGMDQDRYAAIEEKVEVHPAEIKSIHLNSFEIKEFSKHPYISFSLARLLVSYREQHGPYRSIDDVLQIALMDQKNYIRLKPYLSVE